MTDLVKEQLSVENILIARFHRPCAERGVKVPFRLE